MSLSPNTCIAAAEAIRRGHKGLGHDSGDACLTMADRLEAEAQLCRGLSGTPSVPLTDADVRLNAQGDVLEIVTRYGGETIIAGPPMDRMVGELADLVMAWRNGERL